MYTKPDLKPNDIPYLGCESSIKVKSAHPELDKDMLREYYYYLSERNKIFINKEILKKPFPWTNDTIMQTNSFTCDKRYLDRTTKWLVNNIIDNPDIEYEDKVWRSIIFRLYNKIETAELLQLNMPEGFWGCEHVNESIRLLDSTENDPFTRAYKVIRPKYAYRDISPVGHDNWKSSLYWYITTLYNKYNGLVPYELTIDAQSAINFIESNIDGVGDFIAYQIWCDLCYIPEYPMSTNHFTLAGPGCRAGVDMLVLDYDRLSCTEFLFWLRDNIDRLFKSVDSEYDLDKFFYYLPKEARYWDLQDIENSMCEMSKRIYLLENRHKRPRKYVLKE